MAELKPRITSLGHAVADRVVMTMDECMAYFGYTSPSMRQLAQNTQIRLKRWWCDPIGKSVQELADEYEAGALELSCRAVQDCLDGNDISKIGTLVYVSCTQALPECPSMAFRVAGEWGMPGDTRLVDIIGDGCFPAGQLVVTKSGMKDIADIVVGDQVLGHDGELHPVCRTMRRSYTGPVVKLKPALVPAITATPEHPFLVIRGRVRVRPAGLEFFKPGMDGVKQWDWTPQWVEAQELKLGDFVLIPRVKAKGASLDLRVSDYLLPETLWEEDQLVYSSQRTTREGGRRRSTTLPIPASIQLSSNFLRWCGLYIAEGFTESARLKRRGATSLALGATETHLLRQAEVALAELGLPSYTKPNSRGASTILWTSSIPFGQVMSTWFGAGAWHKRFPWWVFDLPLAQKQQLIASMMDGDGCRSPRGDNYRTASLELAYQLTLLLASIGQPASVTSWTQEGSFGIQSINNVRFLKQSQRHGWHLDNEYMWVPIKRLESLPFEGEVYNLEVEGSQSYTVGLASVHNCQGAMPGLEAAYAYLRAFHGPVLLVATEVCSATYFPAPQNDLGNSISNILFNDGSSAMVLIDSSDPQYPAVLDFERFFSKDSKHLLGYTHQDGRMKVQLSRDVPALVPPMVVQTINAMLARNGLTKEDISNWVIHNGGVAILKEIAALMGMDSEKEFRYSWQILREYGNLSSATVGLIAEEMHADPANQHGFVVGAAMGAGAGVGTALLRYG